MKRVLALTIVAMLVFIPLALAGVIDSRENEDIADVEVVDVVYVDDNNNDPEAELAPTFDPQNRDTPNSTSTPAPNDPAASATPEAAPDASPSVSPDASPSAEPAASPSVEPDLTPSATPEVEVSTDVNPSNPDDDPPPPPTVVIVETPTEFEDVYEDINTTYDIVVTYISIDGTPIGDPVTITVEAGEPVNIPMLPIENFSPTSIVNGDNMPRRDVQVTVIYVPEGFDQELINIGDYNTPLGLGASMMNVGVCVE